MIYEVYIGFFIWAAVVAFIILVHFYRKRHNIPNPPAKYHGFWDESLFSDEERWKRRTNASYSHEPDNMWYGLDD